MATVSKQNVRRALIKRLRTTENLPASCQPPTETTWLLACNALVMLFGLSKKSLTCFETNKSARGKSILTSFALVLHENVKAPRIVCWLALAGSNTDMSEWIFSAKPREKKTLPANNHEKCANTLKAQECNML